MHHPKGFTLIELIVAAAVFATVTTLTVNLFILVLRKPLQQVEEQHVQEDVTYMFEVLANMLNDQNINYEAYGGTVVNPSSDLHFISSRPGANEAITMRLVNGQIVGEADFGSFPITSTADVYIDSLRFTVYPTTDPTLFSAGANFQPGFVVQVTGHPVNNPTRTFNAQTFIELRSYVR